MKAKAFVIQQISNNDNEVIVETDKEIGRFGRYIGVIRLADNKQTHNDELVEEGFAKYVEY
nr:thermonuclease family protein [uncultured Draconibacterium sp.]